MGRGTGNPTKISKTDWEVINVAFPQIYTNTVDKSTC